jgi:hypothetical protein
MENTISETTPYILLNKDIIRRIQTVTSLSSFMLIVFSVKRNKVLPVLMLCFQSHHHPLGPGFPSLDFVNSYIFTVNVEDSLREVFQRNAID